MAYPEPFLRLVASGTLYGSESWSWGISLVDEFSAEPEAPDEVPQAIIDAVAAFHTAPSFIATYATLDTLKLNLIGTDGRYVDKTNTVQYDYPDPVPKGVSSGTVPPQVALAITLRTIARRGLASSGRFYVPVPAYDLTADGRLSVANATTIVGYATTLLNALDDAMDDWTPGVVSNVGAGARRVVSHVEVGRVYDTIRTRRISLPEEYVIGDPITQP